VYEEHFLLALGLAVVVEAAAIFLVVRFLFRLKSIPFRRLLFAGVWPTVSTLPYVWFILPRVIDPARSLVLYVVVAELGVLLIEAVILAVLLGLSRGRALTASAAANAASFGLGLLIL
jgi:hypothetical protein